MGAPMTLEECNRWVLHLRDIGKRGWLPEFNKIGGKLVRSHKTTLRAHLAPEGGEWPKTFAKPLPKKGEEAPQLQETASFESVTQAVRTRKGQIAAIIHAKTQEGQATGPWPHVGDYVPMRLRKIERKITKGLIKTKFDKKAARRYREVYGPPTKPQPALIRRTAKFGAKKALKIWDFLTSFSRAFRGWRDGMVYGFERWPRGLRWIRALHYGGPSEKYGGSMPPRPVVGWTKKTQDEALKIFGDGVEKRLKKLG